MSEADWIILRLVKKMTVFDLGWTARDNDVKKTLLYLRRKYGNRKLNRCIDLLNEEYARDEL